MLSSVRIVAAPSLAWFCLCCPPCQFSVTQQWESCNFYHLRGNGILWIDNTWVPRTASSLLNESFNLQTISRDKMAELTLWPHNTAWNSGSWQWGSWAKTMTLPLDMTDKEKPAIPSHKESLQIKDSTFALFVHSFYTCYLVRSKQTSFGLVHSLFHR